MEDQAEEEDHQYEGGGYGRGGGRHGGHKGIHGRLGVQRESGSSDGVAEERKEGMASKKDGHRGGTARGLRRGVVSESGRQLVNCIRGRVIQSPFSQTIGTVVGIYLSAPGASKCPFTQQVTPRYL